MKLTKQQRHMIYMLMLAEWEEEINKSLCGTLIGFCDAVETLFDINGLSLLPEIIKRKPLNHGLYWFGFCNKEGQMKRIEILKECINETYYPF